MKHSIHSACVIALLLTLATVSTAQLKKPTLMLLPSDNWCNNRYYTQKVTQDGNSQIFPDYKRAFREDEELGMVINQIGGLMTEMGYSLTDAEQAVKSLTTSKAENSVIMSSASGAFLMQSPLDMMMQRIKSDIIIYLNWTIRQDVVNYSLEAVDAYTNKRIATASESHKRTKEPVPMQLQKLTKKHVKQFDQQMIAFYDNILQNGREISVEIKVWDNSAENLESTFNGEELLQYIIKWFAENTVSGNFNLSSATENNALFEQVFIPATKDKTALDARGFSVGLQKYLTKEFDIESKIITKGLGKVLIILGEK